MLPPTTGEEIKGGQGGIETPTFKVGVQNPPFLPKPPKFELSYLMNLDIGRKCGVTSSGKKVPDESVIIDQ